MDIATKSTGDSMTATEQNQVTDEIENVIGNTGQTPSSGDLFQLSKGIADYTAHGDFYTDSGSASTYVLASQGSKQAPTAYANGFKVRFVVGNTNTGVSTVNVATLGVKSIKRVDGSALIAGDMTAGDTVILSYDGTDFLLQASSADKTSIDEGLTFTEASARNSGGPVTVLSTVTTIASVNFGTVSVGDRILIGAVAQFTKGGTGGINTLQPLPSGGSTANIVFHDTSNFAGTSIEYSSAAVGRQEVSAICKVTGAGTLTMELIGQSAGSNSTIATNEGQISGYFLRKL